MVFVYLVMQLVEEGRLDLDSPLVGYLPNPIEEYPAWSVLRGDARMQEISARRVLTHTTGWPRCVG